MFKANKNNVQADIIGTSPVFMGPDMFLMVMSSLLKLVLM